MKKDIQVKVGFAGSLTLKTVGIVLALSLATFSSLLSPIVTAEVVGDIVPSMEALDRLFSEWKK